MVTASAMLLDQAAAAAAAASAVVDLCSTSSAMTVRGERLTPSPEGVLVVLTQSIPDALLYRVLVLRRRADDRVCFVPPPELSYECLLTTGPPSMTQMPITAAAASSLITWPVSTVLTKRCPETAVDDVQSCQIIIA